jgi:hypothetical protein
MIQKYYALLVFGHLFDSLNGRQSIQTRRMQNVHLYIPSPRFHIYSSGKTVPAVRYEKRTHFKFLLCLFRLSY